VFELDDRFTGYDAAAVARMRFDGGKMLVRIDPDDPASVRTLEAGARAVDELAAHGLIAMVEPFLSRRGDDGVVNDLSTQAVARSVAIAAGLGGTSAYTWLKLPVVDDMEAVMAATTMPALLLGGDPSGSPEETYASWGRALATPGVRGLMVGRALLYPPDGDVASAVDAAVKLVRAGVAA
jgi:DhnA family fructose-bisphosphate aldolase class Ia